MLRALESSVVKKSVHFSLPGYLTWFGLPKQTPKTRIQVQKADVGSEGKHGLKKKKTGKRDREGKAASKGTKGTLLSQRPPGPAAAQPTGKLGAGVEHRLNGPTGGLRLWGHFHTLVLTSHSLRTVPGGCQADGALGP